MAPRIRRGKAGLLVATALVCSLSFVPQAEAAPGNTTGWLNLRADTNTRSAVLTTIPPNTPLEVECQIRGENVSGTYTTDWWARVRYNGHYGWASRSYLRITTSNVAVCANTWLPGPPPAPQPPPPPPPAPQPPQPNPGGVPQGVTVGDGVHLRTDPTTASPSITFIPRGATVTMQCQRGGQYVAGEYSTDQWVKVSWNGHTGYSSRSYIRVDAANAARLRGCTGGFTNPVYGANFPDPHIMKTGNGYVAFATNGARGKIQTLTSTDMVNWRDAPDALDKLASWSWPGKIWAPEAIRWSDGSYRMYYTTRNSRDWQCLTVATSWRAEGGYRDDSRAPMVCEESEGGSIDSSPFVASDGSKWLYWKNDGNRVGRTTWIKVARLSDDGRSIVGPVKRLFAGSPGWEGNLVEGASVVEINGQFHMFYSANAYDKSSYATGHAVAPRPDGPWTKDPRPVLRSTGSASGPGHGQLIKVGSQWWYAYHAWLPGHEGKDHIGRRMWLSKVFFNGRSVVVQPPTVRQVDNP